MTPWNKMLHLKFYGSNHLYSHRTVHMMKARRSLFLHLETDVNFLYFAEVFFCKKEDNGIR